MVQKIDLNGSPFHFIGIGGIGMSALAYVLAKRKLPVSGSDIRTSHITERLESVGAQIFPTQAATNLDNLQKFIPVNSSSYSYSVNGNGKISQTSKLPQIILSTAINSHNAEYQAAQTLGYPIFHRSELLAALIKDYQSIAIAGTHGKTTTSSMVGYMLVKAGLDPTIIVGGEVDEWEGNARIGESDFLVAEADESDGSLTKHCPKIGVITNIELDHPDHYQNLEQVIDTFKIFAQQSEIFIGCIDCHIVKTQFQPTISYSLNPATPADYTVDNVVYHAQGTQAQIIETGQVLGTLKIQLLGEHNLSNSLAAIAVGRQLGLDFETIAQALATFTGAKRRFECKGKCQGITFIDDYAHHPSEIIATLAAARLQVDEDNYQRVVAIFQPHRYSRTEAFLKDFAIAFKDADLVIVTDIYSAGEKNLTSITGEKLANSITQNHPQVIYHSDLTTLIDLLVEKLRPKDLSLFLGAGNLNQIIPKLINKYSESLSIEFSGK